jgi:hypothetical protein
VVIPLVLAEYLGWKFLGFAVGLPFYVVLVLLTYYRLKNASLSSWWLLPMIAAVRVGPKWEVWSIDLYLTGLISYLPVILGWLAREDLAGDDVGADTQMA